MTASNMIATLKQLYTFFGLFCKYIYLVYWALKERLTDLKLF